MAGSTAERDDSDLLCGLRMDNRNWFAVQQAQGHESLLIVTKPVVLVRHRRPLEHALGIGEI